MADFLTTPLGIVVLVAAQTLLVVAFVMISLLFLVYGDRKIWAAVQMRRGPNVVGPWGLLQTVATSEVRLVFHKQKCCQRGEPKDD